MRIGSRVLLLAVFLAAGFLLTRCGSVAISNLDPAQYENIATATPTP
jgi:hypothetical protein